MEQLLNEVQGPGQRYIDDLPPEILHRVINLLSPRDLKTAVLVNKRWMEMGEDPSLWTWAVVAIDNKEDIQKKLNIRRLQLLQEIRLPNGWGMGESTMTQLFKTIDEIPSVRMIHGLDKCRGIVHAEPSLVARVLNRLEELYLGQWNECDYPFAIPLTPEQLKLLFIAIAEKTNVEYLFLRFNPADFSKIGPDLFGAALSNVEEVELSDIHETISSQHQEALLSAIMVDSSALRKLYGMVWYNPSIDPELIGRALNRLEDVEACVSVEQIAAILRNLVDGQSRLKKLGLAEVEPEEMARLDQEHIRRAKDIVGDIFVYYWR